LGIELKEKIKIKGNIQGETGNHRDVGQGIAIQRRKLTKFVHRTQRKNLKNIGNIQKYRKYREKTVQPP